jgi:hypothetical protein
MQTLPIEWVERIFLRLHGRFGNSFFDKYRIGKLNNNGDDVGLENAKIIWSQELAGISAERIVQGLNASYDYAPSCDDFRNKCTSTPAMYQDNKLLPHKRNPEVSKEGLDKIATVISQTLKPKTDYKAWAKRIVANPQNFPASSLVAAKEALGMES